MMENPLPYWPCCPCWHVSPQLWLRQHAPPPLGEGRLTPIGGLTPHLADRVGPAGSDKTSQVGQRLATSYRVALQEVESAGGVHIGK